MKKFMKEYFLLSDNVIDKKLQHIIDNQEFSKRRIVNQLSKELIEFFAENFTKGNFSKA
jgi:hypothetical protein